MTDNIWCPCPFCGEQPEEPRHCGKPSSQIWRLEHKCKDNGAIARFVLIELTGYQNVRQAWNKRQGDT